MAKIANVTIDNIPETINVGDNITDLVVKTSIEFHPLDISLKMEYQLLLAVYDINGDIDIPVLISNWDETNIYGVSKDRNDHLLGKVFVSIVCDNTTLEIHTPMALKLGDLLEGRSYFSRNLEVFATLIPAIGRASKSSQVFESNLLY